MTPSQQSRDDYSAGDGPVLIAGATGFVGRHLRVALDAAGVAQRLCTRDVARAHAKEPGRDWVAFDLDRPETFAAALQGCRAAYFLVHQVGVGSDYCQRERLGAEHFAFAAAEAGLERIVYLGGVLPPASKRSRHLQSRADTGEILRNGTVPATELRAAMVIGKGSISWQMVRDLATRLPAMVLPSWLRNASWPIAVVDVVFALLHALFDEQTGCFEIPGPERISHRDMLTRVALAMGKRPLMFGVPILSPRLSSYWIGLVTSVELRVATELVQGLVTDLDPSGTAFWQHHPQHALEPLDSAVPAALADDEGTVDPSETMRRRLVLLGEQLRSVSS